MVSVDQTQVTPAGHESNGVVAREVTVDTSCVCQIGYEIVGGRLVKRDTPHNKELELSLNTMEATPEYQHSHHGHQVNPNDFRSMRDRMHPPHLSAPSCIVPPIEQLVIRPHIVPLLPTFHGMESENPYAHIKEFEDVCNTFQEGGASIDLMRLKTNGLKRQISNFSAKENEKFYECWERYMEAINACPHHGFDTWLLFVAMTRRLEELELKKMHEVQAVAETPVQVKPCPICQSYEHLVEECPTIPAAREMLEIKQMSLDNSSPITMLHMEILTTQVGGIIQISHGNQEHLSTNNRLNHLNKLQALNKQ
ncbi:hypothetical protein CK203_115864 [Vitis vinifera]|uniref:Retrotransposon gag domain-containing protein n=1 Tax=Vitis vinifera TaxID=29760 RepID=A0A438FDH2_VITVI|nr:hypothetical protein CK203_115864 [Vitis vinifera]